MLFYPRKNLPTCSMPVYSFIIGEGYTDGGTSAESHIIPDVYGASVV